MRRKTPVLLAVVLAVVVATPLMGQSVPKEQQAEIAIKLDMNRLRGNALYGMLRGNLDQLKSQAEIPDNMDLEKVDSIFAAISLPEDVSGFAAMEQIEEGGDLPIEMYVRVEFNDSGLVDTIMEKAAAESVERQINGKTCYSPKPEDNGPQNIAVYRVDDTTIEFGTENYIAAGTGEHLLSEGLKSAWAKMPEEALRIAVDLENPSDLIAQGVEMAKANSEPMMGGFIDLITKASDIRISMDLDQGNLLTISAMGKDEKSAAELQMGLDGILAFGKMGGAQAVQMLKEQDEDAANVVKSILDSLSAKQDGKDVQIAIPKPDGFEDAIQNMIKMNGMGGDF